MRESTLKSSAVPRQRSLERIEPLHGSHAGATMIDEMKTICPVSADMTIEWATGALLDQPGLNLAAHKLILMASCVTTDHAMPQFVINAIFTDARIDKWRPANNKLALIDR